MEDTISSLLKLFIFLALEKLEAVMSGLREPILFTTSPINASRFFLLPILDNSSISSALLISIVKLDKPCKVPPPTDMPPKW